jgi:hypothetical protein
LWYFFKIGFTFHDSSWVCHGDINAFDLFSIV